MLSKTDVTSANTSETVSRDRGKDWPIADWRVLLKLRMVKAIRIPE